GDLVIADTGSTVLRGVPSGFTSLVTVAGKPEDPGFDEDGNPLPGNSKFNNTLNVVLDPDNNGYIADTDNCVVRKIDNAGKLSTIAGTIPIIDPNNANNTIPQCGFAGAGGPALSATFGKINGVAVDSHGNVFFSDATNNLVWEYV